MKYILILSVLFLSSLCAAQTPSLYDEWTPSFAGMKAHITIRPDSIIVSSSKPERSFSQFQTVPMESSQQPEQESNPKLKTNTWNESIGILKVDFDSLHAKGRMFIREGKSEYISCLPFLIKDDGEISIGFSYAGGAKTLKEAEKLSLNPTKKKKSYGGPCGDMGEGFCFSLYNKTKVAEFAKLKDGSLMAKEEAVSMINSLGDRFSAMLQQDPSSAGNMGYYGLFMGKGQHIVSDIMTAHGYNPLTISNAIEKFQNEDEIKTAFELCGKKIEQSTPELRAEAQRRKSYKGSMPVDSMMTPAPAAPQPAPPPPAEPYDKSNSKDMQKDMMVKENEVSVADPSRDEFIEITAEPIAKQNIQSMVAYPEEARRAGIEGKVAFSALIDKSGKVTKVVIDHSDNKMFDQAVIDAVMKTRFTPATQGKKTVKVWYSQSVSFKLN